MLQGNDVGSHLFAYDHSVISVLKDGAWAIGVEGMVHITVTFDQQLQDVSD